MTLATWTESTGLRVRSFVPTAAHTGMPSGPATGAVMVQQSDTYGLSGRLKWALYHLEDYVVSSVTGGAIWLAPRVLTCGQCQQVIDSVQSRMSSMRSDNAQPTCKDCVSRELTAYNNNNRNEVD